MAVVTALDLAPIKARLAAAQVGDWTSLTRYGHRYLAQHLILNSSATREFVAHSRRDVEALVAEVERLRAALQTLVDAEGCHRCAWDWTGHLCTEHRYPLDVVREALGVEAAA